MARLKRDVVISAPAERVWSVLVDPERSPDWEAGLVAVEDFDERLDQPDTSCVQVMTFRRGTLRGDFVVTEAFPPHTRAARIQPPLTVSATRRERLVQTEDGTRLTIELEYATRGGPIGLLLDLALTRPRLGMMLVESGRNLKRLVESEL